ncbi:SusC/RagA family TonB-linked outer membrane protein [Aureibacter tunicatorum]|uniref:TonB-linked SusC/RagA family outer membrane protein n=1 Tax=Aureibacter tunicatorum TaxID=866807 RepID=A0AAE3XTW1_9BACT|nr:TonB-dependent receptor [Aureibacter tunicatorum]MDR6241988.1 TonB-linked SusC/RagA family outer membrane protein [Aureibacter tunicatorum]BDD07279.1 SusC/RagA family TonB-linked outer membrane protein [Aureibacter tunicatorum]
MCNFYLSRSKGLSRLFCSLIAMMMIGVLMPIGGYASTEAVDAVMQTGKQVSGTVLDEQGMPIPGANVLIKGTSNGTITDFDGNFTLEVDNETVLVFSFVGYLSQEVQVGNKNRVDVSLEPDVKQLDEIVVVGYGVQKKSDLSSAVSSLKAEEVNKIASTSPAQMIQGRTSGVSVVNSGSPGAAPYVKIRGMSSFGDVQPLYVIDGVPGGDITMVSPDEIESFEVLKDGAAAAIYGSLAANGVILVTTKSGKKEQPMKITVNAYGGVQSDMNRLPMANSQEHLMIMDQAYSNSIADGAIGQGDLPGYLNPESGFNVNNYADTDWQDATLRTATIQNYSIGMSGGGESSTYHLSANYLNQEGVVVNSGTERYNFRLKSTFEKGNLKVMPNIAYSRQTWENNTMDFLNMQRALPFVAPYDQTKESGYGYMNEYGLRSSANPVGQSELLNDITTKDQLVANLGLQYQITDDLVASGNLGYAKSFYKNRYDYPAYVLASDTKRQDPYLREYRSEWYELNYDFTLTYSKTFAEKHSLSVMAGLVGYLYDYGDIDVNVRGGFMFPDFGGLDPSFSGGASGDFIGEGSFTRFTRFGLMSRVNYSYDDRFLIQGTIRRDASSKFGSNNRWGNFPSVSAAWKMQNEAFMEPIKHIVTELKPRVSYGILGRETNLNAYDRQALVYGGMWYVMGGEGTGGIYTFDMANSNLKWEQSKTFNAGVDFGLFDDKLYGTFNYYQNDSESLLFPEPNNPPSSGMESPMVNIGKISNRGIELEIGYRNSVGDLKYDISGNMTTINNKVQSLPAPAYGNSYSYLGLSSQTLTQQGSSASQFHMYKTDGIFRSQSEVDAHVDQNGNLIQPNAKPGDVRYVDVNGDGTIDANDMTDVGSPIPNFEYAFNINLAYKGFDLSMFFQGVSGNKILNVNRYNMENPGSGFNMSSDLTNAWTPENPNTSTPRNVIQDNNNNYMMSDRYLEDGSYFRLKNIQIGYTLPKELVSKINVTNLRVYLNADNVFTITNYSGYDPEIVPINAFTQGYDMGTYPMFRTFTVGAQLTF